MYRYEEIARRGERRLRSIRVNVERAVWLRDLGRNAEVVARRRIDGRCMLHRRLRRWLRRRRMVMKSGKQRRVSRDGDRCVDRWCCDR